MPFHTSAGPAACYRASLIPSPLSHKLSAIQSGRLAIRRVESQLVPDHYTGFLFSRRPRTPADQFSEILKCHEAGMRNVAPAGVLQYIPVLLRNTKPRITKGDS